MITVSHPHAIIASIWTMQLNFLSFKAADITPFLLFICFKTFYRRHNGNVIASACGHVSDIISKSWLLFELCKLFSNSELPFKSAADLLKHGLHLNYKTHILTHWTPLVVLMCVYVIVYCWFTDCLFRLLFFYIVLSYMILNCDESGRSCFSTRSIKVKEQRLVGWESK